MSYNEKSARYDTKLNRVQAKFIETGKLPNEMYGKMRYGRDIQYLACTKKTCQIVNDELTNGFKYKVGMRFAS